MSQRRSKLVKSGYIIQKSINQFNLLYTSSELWVFFFSCGKDSKRHPGVGRKVSSDHLWRRRFRQRSQRCSHGKLFHSGTFYDLQKLVGNIIEFLFSARARSAQTALGYLFSEGSMTPSSPNSSSTLRSWRQETPSPKRLPSGPPSARSTPKKSLATSNWQKKRGVKSSVAERGSY